MIPLQTLADAWLVRYPSFSSTGGYSHAPATSLYIVLFYSLNKPIFLSDLLVTLVHFVKYPTSTQYPPESI